MQSDDNPLTPKQETSQSNQLENQLNQQFEQLLAQHPSLDIDQVFYLEATRLHQQLITKGKEVGLLQREVMALKRELGMETVERRRSVGIREQENGSDKKKRMRRTAVEIARHYVCNIERCNKSYGSEGSLNQHIKIKHKQHYTKEMFIMDHLNRSQ